MYIEDDHTIITLYICTLSSVSNDYKAYMAQTN